MREVPFQLRKMKLLLEFDEVCDLGRLVPEISINCNGEEVLVGGPEALSTFSQELKHDYVWGQVSEMLKDLQQRTHPKIHAEIEQARRVADERSKLAMKTKLDSSKFRVNRVAEPEVGVDV